MKYTIVIPSYKRQETLRDKTLAYLKRTNISMKSIVVFVANKEEFKSYAACLGKEIKIVLGKETLCGQRKFIRHYFKQGEFIFSIDDDIKGIYKATSKKKLEEVLDLHRFLLDAFALCVQVKATLWGVSAVLNPFFMFGKAVSIDLKYICGGAYGEVVDLKNKHLDVELEDKEDFERSIIHFMNRGLVIRFNNFALGTQGYQGKGGMQETRTKERIAASANFLLKKYPTYCKLNTGKKNKTFVEIKLIKQ